MNAGRRDLVGALDALIRAIDNADRIEALRDGMILGNARRVLRRAKSGAVGPVPWTPFEPATWTADPTAAQIKLIAKLAGCDETRAREYIEQLATGERVYVNSRYQVHVREFRDGGVHLSIKRLDQGRHPRLAGLAAGFPIGWHEGRLISDPDHGPAAQRRFEDPRPPRPGSTEI